MTRPEPLQPGAMLGRFKIVEPIGSGAMGAVYTAVDPDLGRTVAIKVLHDEASRARLIREAQAMARLAHPNVVPVHEIGSADPLYIVMERVPGGTLRQWLAEPRDLADIIDAFEQAGRGLAAAHAAGLVHRDFKPENVLRGEDGRVRVVDFGLVAARGDVEAPAPVISEGSSFDVALTHTGFVLGTPAYMSPEQHRGEVADARSDQFSFAVAFYEALYGERPFAGKTYREMVRNVYAGTVSSAPAGTRVPVALRQVLLRALATDPAARHASMTELLDKIEGIARTNDRSGDRSSVRTSDRPATSQVDEQPMTTTPRARRRSTWIVGGAAALALAATVLIAQAREGASQPRQQGQSASEQSAAGGSSPGSSVPQPAPAHVPTAAALSHAPVPPDQPANSATSDTATGVTTTGGTATGVTTTGGTSTGTAPGVTTAPGVAASGVIAPSVTTAPGVAASGVTARGVSPGVTASPGIDSRSESPARARPPARATDRPAAPAATPAAAAPATAGAGSDDDAAAERRRRQLELSE